MRNKDKNGMGKTQINFSLGNNRKCIFLASLAVVVLWN
jgi:hypothetical protein